jgi:hypothetical protein
MRSFVIRLITVRHKSDKIKEITMRNERKPLVWCCFGNSDVPGVESAE